MHAPRRVYGVTAACFLPAPFTGRFNSCLSQLPKSATASHGSRGSGPPRSGPPLPDPHLLPRHAAPPALGCRWRRGPRPPAAQPGDTGTPVPAPEAETHFAQDKSKPCPGVFPRSAAAAPLTSHAEQRHGGPDTSPRLSSCRPADTGRRRRLSRGGAVPPGQGRVTTDASGGARRPAACARARRFAS